jgi:GNAT superfamily N-acetyltransferase
MEDLVVSKLGAADRVAWQELFGGYLAFYETSLEAAGYDRAWEEFQRDERMHALCARADGELTGIVHFLEHASTTAADVCYLQDLFTAPDARGRGVGRALIAAVVEAARDRGCSRVYWVTHETNATARALYDKVALNSGFIRYQIAL